MIEISVPAKALWYIQPKLASAYQPMTKSQNGMVELQLELCREQTQKPGNLTATCSAA